MTASRTTWSVGMVSFAALLALGGCPAAATLDSNGNSQDSAAEIAGDQTTKNRAPRVNAGTDAVVGPGDLVVLNGSQTRDDDGDQIMFIWQQVDGESSVPLTGVYSSIARFNAPEVDTETTLTFRLIAVDGKQYAADDVVVTILPPQ